MDATRLALIATMAINTLLIAACGSKTATKVSEPNASCYPQAVKNSFLVKWKSEVPEKWKSKEISPGSRITRFRGIEKSELENTVLKSKSGEAESAEYEFQMNILEPSATFKPSASSVDSAWGPTDIHVSEAWNFAAGRMGQGVTVAVIDSGVDLTHRYLSSQIYMRPTEIPYNGIDDDGNGFVDDFNGYNFAERNYAAIDNSGHGTHVAGIIAGQPGPNSFVGVAPKAKILPLKFIGSDGMGLSSDAALSIRYAKNSGAKVINASWNGSGCSPILKDEISSATSAGVLFVTSAGNKGVDISNPYLSQWPAAFTIPGKIVVGSMNPANVLSVFSNYGPLVDLAAPGENILSTYPPLPGQSDDQFGILSGTSMAAPFVSGVAAILFSINPSATPAQVSEAILNSVSPGYFGVRTKGKIDALAAVQYFLSH